MTESAESRRVDGLVSTQQLAELAGMQAIGRKIEFVLCGAGFFHREGPDAWHRYPQYPTPEEA